MKLARYLPLALVAAARAQDGLTCETEAIEFQKCVTLNEEPEEGACSTCLEKHVFQDDEDGASPPTDDQIDAAVLACTAVGQPCEGCADQTVAMATCGKKQLASAREEL